MTFSDSRSRTKHSNTWLHEILRSTVADRIDLPTISASASKSGMCVICKGSRLLCGKTRCPIIVKATYYIRSVPLMSSEEISGASPPGVFVGRIGYPHVYAGPLVPPVRADTSLYDVPEQWFGKSIDEIVAFRSLLIRGKHRVHVQDISEAGRIIENTRELGMAARPVDLELRFSRRPHGSIFMSDDIQPFGPSAPIRGLHLGNTHWDQHIEKAYYDTDLKAVSAVVELYKNGTLVTKIQRAFSVGAFGIKKNRRLVPTRWSITAVDDILSKDLIKQIRVFPEINEYRVYESRYLDNVFEVIMIPDRWSYEAIEAWYPGTVWNPSEDEL